MGDICKALKLYSDVVNMYRFYPFIDRVEMTRRLNTSGTTFYKAVDDLQKKGVLIQKAGNSKGKTDSTYSINGNLMYMLGISIGASLCKISFVGLDFRRMPASVFAEHKANLINNIKSILQNSGDELKELKECEEDNSRDYIFFSTPNSFRCLKQVINSTFDYCRTIIERKIINLFSIGISSTGIIDRDAQKIIKSHNLPYLEGIKIDGLIDPTNRDFFFDNNITVSLVQNSDASVIAEIIQLYLINSPFKGKNNIASLYLGYGVGTGLYLDGKIYNGCHGFAGETGQLAAPLFKEECFIPYTKAGDVTKASIDSADNDIITGWNRNDQCPIFSSDIMSYDEKIRRYVFEKNPEEEFKHMSSSEILSFLENHLDKDGNRDKAILLGKYLGGIVNTITNLLNVELIIFTGKIYKSFDLIANTISQEQYVRGVKLGRTGRDDCELVKSSLGSLSPAIGAAIYSYHKKCDIPLSWNYPDL